MQDNIMHTLVLAVRSWYAYTTCSSMQSVQRRIGVNKNISYATPRIAHEEFYYYGIRIAK